MAHYFITGASSGIGEALVRRLLAGAQAEGQPTVSAVARRADRLAAIGSTHEDRFLALPGDVTDEAAMAAAVDAAVERFGPVSVAVLNAGIYTPQNALNIAPAEFARHMDVNYMGVVNALPRLIHHMQQSGGGQLAIVSSVAGWRGLPKAAAYGPTKAALISLAESLHFDLAPCGIDVRVICPGFVETESTAINDHDMPGLISAAKAAEEILKGLKSNAFTIDFPKSFTRQIGLLRWLPDRLFLRIVAARTGH